MRITYETPKKRWMPSLAKRLETYYSEEFPVTRIQFEGPIKRDGNIYGPYVISNNRGDFILRWYIYSNGSAVRSTNIHAIALPNRTISFSDTFDREIVTNIITEFNEELTEYYFEYVKTIHRDSNNPNDSVKHLEYWVIEKLFGTEYGNALFEKYNLPNLVPAEIRDTFLM